MFRAMADLLYLSYDRIEIGTYLSLRKQDGFAFPQTKSLTKFGMNATSARLKQKKRVLSINAQHSLQDQKSL
jgi:hypothetical protein